MCDTVMDTVEYKKHTIKIQHDKCSENPRTSWDNLGTMVVFWHNYDLGDKHGMTREEAIKCSERKDIISLPIYVYEHSNIAMSTGAGYPFNDQWDAGCAGFIYITKKKVRKEYGWKVITKQRIAQIEKYLKSEVETQTHYVSGSVYYYAIENEAGEDIEDGSCGGFYGYDHESSGLMEFAKDAIDCEIKYQKEQEKKNNPQLEMELI